MNVYLKSGIAAVILGLGVVASGGSAYAAGCLSADQTVYSLTDHTDTATDNSLAADTKGYRCDVSATVTNTAPSATTQHNTAQAQQGVYLAN